MVKFAGGLNKMKSARKRRVKLKEAPAEHNLGTCNIGVMKSTKRITVPCHKAVGRTGDISVENDGNIPPTSPAVPCKQPSENEKCPVVTTNKLSVLDPYPAQVTCPTTKIKLQLFPMDESTRMGLEKDGFHPYLELTLSTKKKISSVIKHINSKWGHSTIAFGETILFPYSTAENMANCRWTMNDSGTSAGDVLTAIGNPAVFRLRYGWFSNSEAKISGVPSTSTLVEGHFQGNCSQIDFNNEVNNKHGKVKETETREEFKPNTVNGDTNEVSPEKISSDRPVDPVDEVRVDSSITQPSLLWADSLTNISIGGLLSEASLQGKVSNCNTRSNGMSACLQPSQLISDSFDAFLAGQMNQSQAPTLPPHDSHSSILDAEDTCQAFSFQKFSTSENDGLHSRESAYLNSSSQRSGARPFKFPNLNEANHPSVDACQESETNLQLCSRLYNDESSLGLSSIKWSDSLGPFDLDLSSSRKIIG